MIDAVTSQPVAKVKAQVSDGDARIVGDRAVTDEKGECELTLTLEKNLETIQFDRDGYPRMEAIWNFSADRRVTKKHSVEDLPKEFEMRLPPGRELSGTVTDDGNTPVSDVYVMLMCENEPPSQSDWPIVQLAHRQVDPQTDASGHWQTDRAPQALDRVSVIFGHADFLMNFQPGPQVEHVVLKQGIRLTGHVLDTAGKPIVGAKVGCNDEMQFVGLRDTPTNLTNADGEFDLSAISAGKHGFSVFADGYVSTEFEVEMKPGVHQDFVLEKAHQLWGKVIDEHGKGIPFTHMIAVDLKGNPNVRGNNTNENGEFSLGGTPPEPTLFEFSARGYQPKNVLLQPDSEATITLAPISQPTTVPSK